MASTGCGLQVCIIGMISCKARWVAGSVSGAVSLLWCRRVPLIQSVKVPGLRASGGCAFANRSAALTTQACACWMAVYQPYSASR